MRIAFGTAVVDATGDTVGAVSGLAFEERSWRVAGFLVRLAGGVPREILIQPGQVTRIARDRLTLTLDRGELRLYPDARQHLYVAPGQELAEELAAAEAEGELPAAPDPDEWPAPTAIPGFALLPGYTTPLEVERSLIAENQFAFGEGLRVVTRDGEDLGPIAGVTIEETRLTSVILRENERAIPDDLLAGIDEDGNQLLLTVAAADLTGALRHDEPSDT